MFSAIGPLHYERALAVAKAVRDHCETLGLNLVDTERCITIARNEFLEKLNGARAVALGRKEGVRLRTLRSTERAYTDSTRRQRRMAFALAAGVMLTIFVLVGAYAFTHPVTP